MSRLSFLNQTTFRIYSYKYKMFVTPILVIFVCLILFITFIIPQVQQWLLMQQQIALSEQRLEILTSNLNFAGKINGGAVDKYLQLVSRSLPSDKDFIGVLAAISNAAINSAISLNDYSFQVGDLSSETKDNLATLPVTITINGGLDDLKRFSTSLRQQLPLSDITEINLSSGNLATVTIKFYYKPFPEKISFQPSKPLQTLSPQEQSLMKYLLSLDASSKRSTISIQENLIQ